jgi:aminopeptidase YwaD
MIKVVILLKQFGGHNGMLRMAETSVIRHLSFFVESIGPRPVGSPGYHQAAEYIRAAFHRSGLQIEELQYECADWRHERTILESSGERLTAAANVFSPACDVTAPTTAIRTVAQLEMAEITGKIAVLYGDLSAAPLIPINCPVYNTERDQHINRLVEAKKPVAVIAVNLNPPAVDSLIEDADFTIPSATVPAEVGLWLLEHVGAPVHLKIEAERVPSQAQTIIGTKVGTSANRIVLMAHYDTKVDTPGAWDNGSGIAALLALAETLTQENLEVGLEFIAFGDEEYYAYTDGMYVERYGSQMADIILAINIDGVGQQLGTNNVALMAASEPLRNLLDETLKAYPGVIWIDPWPQSNHSTFAWRGVPSVALNSRGVMSLIHQPQDTMMWMSEAKLGEVVSLVGDIVTVAQDKSPAWTRP